MEPHTASAPLAADPVSGRVFRFERVAVAEGVSFLLLLGVAMPLKYLAGFALAVKVVGWAHGVLFVAYGLLLAQLMLRDRLAFGLSVRLFVAALVPFGPWLARPALGRWLRERHPA